MKKKTIIIIVVCIALAYMVPFGLIFAGIFINDRFELTEFEETKNGYLIEDKISVTNLEGTYNEEKNVYVITGTVTNKSDKEYSSGDLTFQVYDKEGTILGDASTYVNNFKAGKSWKFKAIYELDDANEASSFELINTYFYQG